MASSVLCIQDENCNIITQNRYGDIVTDFGTHTVYKDLPPFCVETPGDLPTSEGEIWNCNRCGNDQVYFIPWYTDDMLQFQFQEHDYLSADWKTPTYGWEGSGGTDQLCRVFVDVGCIGVWAKLTTFAAGVLEGWCAVDSNSEFNYQVIKIGKDAFVPNGCCVKFKFEFYNPGGVYKTFYSESYDIGEACLASVKLEGVYNDRDCEGFYYGEPASAIGLWSGSGNPDALYTHTVYLYAKFFQTGFEYGFTRSNYGVNTSKYENKIYELRGKLVPPFVASELGRIYGAGEIFINDGAEPYYYKETVFSKQIENSRMWRIKNQFTDRKCQIFFGCATN